MDTLTDLNLVTSKQENVITRSQKNRNRKLPKWIQETLAEMIGTYLLVMIGDSAVANYKLNRDSKVGVDHFAVAFAFGIGAMAGIAASSQISGSHMNPAVTLAFAIIGKLSFRKMAHYLFGQYMGAFLAATTVYLAYHEAIDAFDGGKRVPYQEIIDHNQTNHLIDHSTGVIYSTYPAIWITETGALLDQIIATFALVFSVLVITGRKAKLPDYLHPFMLGMLICGIVIAFGLNCGAALNPARDFSPRLFQLISGYGWKAFKPVNSFYWLLAGILGPHIGAILAAWMHQFFTTYTDSDQIELHLSDELPSTGAIKSLELSK